MRDLLDALLDGPDRARDRTWLPPGSEGVLAAALAPYPELSEAGRWAVALCLVSLHQGGTCLDLDAIAEMPEARSLPAAFRRYDAAQWRHALAAITTTPAPVQPLQVCGGVLYFDRYLRFERRIAANLLAPLSPAAMTKPAGWEEAAQEIFDGERSVDLQREAAERCWEHRCTVLAGGPGTGKTTTIAKFLAAALRCGALTGRDVVLCAPTGKAAQRMGAAVTAALEQLGFSSEEVAVLSDRFAPRTIHRVLGITPRSPRRRHATPLRADLVVVDETSMVDVTLLAELLEAIGPETRVVLVGDPDQLQSIDVGSTMGDLVAAMRAGLLPGTELEVSHRVAGGDRAALLELFGQIRRGDVDAVLERCSTPTPGFTFVAVDGVDLPAAGEAALEAVLWRARTLLTGAAADDLAVRDAALGSVMVLCAQHQGYLSRSWWTDRVAAELGLRLGALPTTPGIPVLITATDQAVGVRNGDDGLVCRRGSQVVVELTGGDRLQVDPAMVPSWQPWWAMTIHKAQGSEFDEVVVSLTPGTRLATRELLYTAVTRARAGVTLIGRLEDVAEAVRRGARRPTGLVDRLAELAPAT